MEGWKKGKITEIFPVTQIRKDHNNIIDRYYINDKGWVSKEECIALAKAGRVALEVCTSRLGNAYLRASGSNPYQKDLNQLPQR